MSYSVEDLQTERIVTVDGEQMDGNRLVRGPMSIRRRLLPIPCRSFTRSLGTRGLSITSSG